MPLYGTTGEPLNDISTSCFRAVLPTVPDNLVVSNFGVTIGVIPMNCGATVLAGVSATAAVLPLLPVLAGV